MKKIFFLLLTLAITFFSVSCASKKADPAPAPEQKVDQMDMPEWFFNPPQSTEFLYGVGVAKMARIDQSKKFAEARARNAIAEQIDITVQETIIDYFQEAGELEETQALQFAENISKQIVNTKLRGVKPKEYYPAKDGTVYCLVEYSLESFLTDAGDEFVRNEASAFAEFKADQALKKLESDLANTPPSTVVKEAD